MCNIISFLKSSWTQRQVLHIKFHSSINSPALLHCATWCLFFQFEARRRRRRSGGAGRLETESEEETLGGLGAAWWPSSSSAHWLSTFYWFDWAAWVRGCWRRCLGILHFLRSDTEEKITSCLSYPYPPSPPLISPSQLCFNKCRYCVQAADCDLPPDSSHTGNHLLTVLFCHLLSAIISVNSWQWHIYNIIYTQM